MGEIALDRSLFDGRVTRATRSLRARLVFLTIVAAVPAIGLVAADAERTRRAARTSVREAAAVTLARLADALRRELDLGRVFLDALAANAVVATGGAAACRAALEPLVAGLPHWEHVARRTASGVVTCSAHPRRAEVGTAPPRLELTRRLPGSEGRRAAFLGARIRLDWLQTVARDLALPQGSHVVVFDAAGTRLFGSEGAPGSMPGPVASALRGQRPGVPTLAEADDALWAAQTIADPVGRPLRLAVVTSGDAATSGSRGLVARQLGLMLLGALALAAIAAVGADRLLARPIRAIADAVRRLSDGDLTARVPDRQSIPELAAFALAFNQMAEAVEERNRQLAALAERAPDGILRVAPDGVILYANPAMAALVAALPGTLVGQPVTDALPSALGTALRELAAVAAARRDATDRELEIGTGETRRILEVRAVPEQGDEASVPVVLAVVRDVSEARRTAEALRQAQKLDGVGRLAGAIAHDFNNLLTGIVGHADLALDALDDGHPAREEVDALRAAAMRSTGMTRQLLMFARQQAPTLATLDVGELIHRVRGLLERVLGDAVRLRLELAPGLPAVEADPMQLEQVLMNLAANARDAMPSGGTLTLRTRLAEVEAGDAMRIGVRQPGAHLALEVEDTGSGMPPDVLARIFEPFFSTKAPGEGTGLGLSTCYGIAKEHGGALVASSAVGIGSRFTLYLPSSAAAARGTPAPSDAWRTAPAGGREALLVAEDDAGLRRLLVRMLRSRGYVVHEAEDGAAALALATGPAAPSLALVITDVRMPRLGGDAFVRQLRRAHPGLPVLYMTGNPGIADGAGRLDGAPLLTKPFTSVQLLHAIRRILDRAAVA